MNIALQHRLITPLDFFRVLPSQFGAHTPAITDFTPLLFDIFCSINSPQNNHNKN